MQVDFSQDNSCTRCNLAATRTNYVANYTPDYPKLFVISLMPSVEADLTGTEEPDYYKDLINGLQLNKTHEAISKEGAIEDITLDTTKDIAFWNVLKCRSNKPLTNYIKPVSECYELNKYLFKLHKPKVILTIDEEAFQYFSGACNEKTNKYEPNTDYINFSTIIGNNYKTGSGEGKE